MEIKATWLLLALLCIVMPPAIAGANSSNARIGALCHELMTADECLRFKSELARLHPGVERERLLARQLETIRERETTCGCDRAEMAVVTYPQRQALQRF